MWKHDDPLAKREVSSLAKILREGAVEQLQHDEHELKAPQKGNRSAKIHFVWDVITERLTGAQATGNDKKPKGRKMLSFKEFWEESVDSESTVSISDLCLFT